MGLRPLEIFHLFQSMYRVYKSESDVFKDGPHAERVKTVYRWSQHFAGGTDAVEDYPSIGKPRTTLTTSLVQRAETLIVEEVCKMGRVQVPHRMTEERKQGVILIDVEEI